MGTTSSSVQWFCYMLRCRDSYFYVVITNDLEDRIREHHRGKDSDYTAKRRPVELVWSEPHASRQAARQREVEIKGWSRRKKMEPMSGLPSPSPKVNPSPSAQGKGASD